MGSNALSNNFNSFAPGLGAMMEDAEDAVQLEDGEIPDMYRAQPTHQPRSQSQSFVAPRFAALAAQQEADAVGPTGRPQLAPNFSFGARKLSRGAPMAPPISEEDIGFQFPQQQQQHPFPSGEGHRKTDSNGEITGIMAEQVHIKSFYISNHGLKICLDRSAEPD
jgi:protein SSD1